MPGHSQDSHGLAGPRVMGARRAAEGGKRPDSGCGALLAVHVLKDPPPPPWGDTALSPPRRRLRPFGHPLSRGSRPSPFPRSRAELTFDTQPAPRARGWGRDRVSRAPGRRGRGGGVSRPNAPPFLAPTWARFGVPAPAPGRGPARPSGPGCPGPRRGAAREGGRAPGAPRPRPRRALLRGGIIEPRSPGPALAAEARPERGTQEPRAAPRAFVRPPPAARRPHGARRA